MEIINYFSEIINGKLGLSVGGRSGLDLVKYCTLFMLKPGLCPPNHVHPH